MSSYINTGNGHNTRFIVVEGNVGSGKTEFCHMLCRVRAEHNGPCEVLLEPVMKPVFRRLLDLYYKEPKRWALAFQIFALKERFKQHTWAAELVANGNSVVQDRSIYADGCFGSVAHDLGNMTDDEWDIYRDTFGAMKRFLRYPDIMLYLRVPPETCKQRIDLRARTEEGGIPIDYLKRLDAEHEILAKEMSRFTRVLTVDWSHFGSDVEALNARIEEVCQEDIRFMRDFRSL